MMEVRDLTVSYVRRGVALPALRRVSLEVREGECLGVVGESGSGKSTLAHAVVGYLPPAGRVDGGRVRLAGRDLLGLAEAEWRAVRAREMALIPQSTGQALNPARTVGGQLREVAHHARRLDRRRARAAALHALEQVRMEDPQRVARSYPHQLSGGMQQRALIAMALLHEPRFLVLDEPTTGQDATVEAEILELLAEVRRDLGVAMLLITHDLGVVAKLCDRTAVVYAGRVVEEGSTSQVLAAPRHPYTEALVSATPQAAGADGLRKLVPIPGRPPALGAYSAACDFAPRCPLAVPRCREELPALVPSGTGRASRCFRAEDVAPSLVLREDERRWAGPPEGAAPVLDVRALEKRFRVGRREVAAVAGVSFRVHPGEVVALVGESGSGKSTVARCLVGLHRPDAGTVTLDGEVLPGSVEQRTPAQRRAVQMVFQDARGALNPRRSVRAIVATAVAQLDPGAPDVARRVAELLELVHLGEELLERRPGDLSGGQAQRIAIARALAGAPSVLVCDEPTSSLDVSVQAAVLNVLRDACRRTGTAVVFISHDLGVVRYLADHVVVLRHGEVQEAGAVATVLRSPSSAYTRALVAAATSSELAEAVGAGR